MNFFVACNPEDDIAQLYMLTNRLHWDAWRSVLPGLDEDGDLAFARIARRFGVTYYRARGVVFAFEKLSFLPRLTRLQEKQWMLDMDRIVAIGYELKGVDADVLAVVDLALEELFSPRQMNQVLPSESEIRRTIREVLAQHYLPEEGEPVQQSYRMKRNGATADFAVTLEASAAEALDRLVRKRAQQDSLSFAEAFAAVFLEQTQATVVINTFQPEGSSLAFLPGAGFLDPRLFTVNSTERPVSPTGKEGYQSHSALRAFAEGRDGTCRMAGCDKPAWRSQLDHRIEYERGGGTHSDNLVDLCQEHHNWKTDRRVFYLMDPANGDVYWLFGDGTWAVDVAAGPIGTTETNWRLSVAQHMDLMNGGKRMRIPEADSFEDAEEVTAQPA